MTTHHGTCHCGAVEVSFESVTPPEDTVVRECQCSFCRRHATMTVCDSTGSAVFTETRHNHLQRYQFGLATADYLLCRNCGCYMGCVIFDADDSGYAIINIRNLDNQSAFSALPLQPNYDAEAKEDRVARRVSAWTPATIRPFST